MSEAVDAGSVTVQSSDVIRLMLQFMKEHNLVESMAALRKESGVTLNSVANLQHFASDIAAGRWDNVLREVSTLSLPERKSMDLYEHICHEMVEYRDVDAARSVMQHAGPMNAMKRDYPDRFVKLAALLRGDRTGLYAHGTKEKVRARLAEDLSEEVVVVPGGRLQTLLNSALKFEQLQGRLAAGMKYDLFRGAQARKKKEPESYPQRKVGEIPFPKIAQPSTAAFTPDGQYLVTGTIDGFIEVWDFEKRSFPKALQYQLDDKIMLMDEPVLSICLSRDSTMLASGSKAGKIKVFRVATGKCLRRFNHAHGQGVTGLCFNRDGSQVASCSYDETARIHGLRSGKTLREFKGHTAYVNSVAYTGGDSYLVTASDDGSVKVWRSKTAECISTFRAPQREAMVEIPILLAQPMPRAQDMILVCTKSNSAYLVNLQGQVVKTFEAKPAKEGVEAPIFVDCATSAQGKYVYCVTGPDSMLYVFSTQDSQVEHTQKLGEAETLGVTAHPHLNVTACHTTANMSIWKP